MKISNNHDLPAPLVSAVEAQEAEERPGDISCSALIDAPQIRVLKKKHYDEIVEDASDRIYMLLGSSVHYMLNVADTSNHTAEKTLRMIIEGWEVTGTADLYDNIGVLDDYKVTSVYSFLLGLKTAWIAQLNVYGQLHRENSCNVGKLRIVAILRDWMKSKALYDKDYPQAPALVQEVPLWSEKKAKAYMLERVKLHQDAELKGIIPDCTDEETWKRTDQFAVKKPANKKASRVFDTEMEAIDYIKAMDARKQKEYEIEHRPGKYVRCEDYCSVAQWCPQWKRNKEEGGQ